QDRQRVSHVVREATNGRDTPLAEAAQLRDDRLERRRPLGDLLFEDVVPRLLPLMQREEPLDRAPVLFDELLHREERLLLEAQRLGEKAAQRGERSGEEADHRQTYCGDRRLREPHEDEPEGAADDPAEEREAQPERLIPAQVIDAGLIATRDAA